MAQKKKEREHKVTVSLDDRQMQMIEEMNVKYKGTPASCLEQLLVATISDAYFMEISAAKDYFEGRPPVKLEEAEEARQGVVVPVLQSVGDLRDEAVMYGLLLAAWDLAVKICKEARYVYPGQHAAALLDEFTRAIVCADARSTEKASPPEVI